jgi:hypothetical protein
MSSLGLSAFSDPARGTIWSPARVASELASLKQLDFFDDISHAVVANSLQVFGIVSATQEETGRKQSLRIRMEYPPLYPWEIPSVFDDEKIFTPSADGHQFPNYSLCLTFPHNEEFTLGSEELSTEVLGASLIWVDKRFIFARTGQWPGEAEKHGWALPLCRLLRGEVRKCGNPWLNAWTEWIIAQLIAPNPTAKCPCQSGITFQRCHRRLLYLAMSYLVWSKYERELYERRATIKAA